MLFSTSSLFGCAEKENTDKPIDPPKGNEELPAPDPSKYVIQPAALGENVDIHTEAQAGYLNDHYSKIADYADAPSTEASYPKEIELSWDVLDANDAAVSPDVTYLVSVSTSPDMTGAKQYTATSNRYALCNLYVGTTYYWKVSFAEGGATYESEIASFTTAGQAPRNVRIDGMTNCRDLGGWKTTKGLTVKQGMIYRTGRVDKITAEGEETILNELGMKTEIDLYGGSPHLDVENYLRCAIADTATLNDLKPKLFAIFATLADERNYPACFHCVIGTDRTGTLAYLILGLLGVSEEDIYRDYCFSNFGNIGVEDADGLRMAERLQGKVAPIKSKTGSTLQQKVRNYLISVGISDETLNAVVQIMLEG